MDELSAAKLQRLVDFIFEIGAANNITRSHSHFLREAKDTIASHSFRCAVIGLILAELEGADSAQVVKTCLLHDLAEVRTGDANYVNKFYRSEHDANENKAIEEQWQDLPGGDKMVALLAEFNERSSKESIVAKDADRLDQIFLQIEYLREKPEDLKIWHEYHAKTLETESAKEIAVLAAQTNPLKWLYNFVPQDN